MIPEPTLDELTTILDETPTPYQPPPQEGPLAHHDREMRCASRGCGSSTYYKLHDIPRCMTHALLLMNEELYNKEKENA